MKDKIINQTENYVKRINKNIELMNNMELLKENSVEYNKLLINILSNLENGVKK